MKFHHAQKVIVKKDFYRTYKGFIENYRKTKDNIIEYQILVIQKKSVTEREDYKPIREWIKESDLKVSWF